MNHVTREEFAVLVDRQDRAEDEMHEMGRDIKQIRCDTTEVVEMFRALSGGIKVLQWLGKLALLITAIGSAFMIIKGWFK